MQDIRIIFAGTPDFAVPTLRALIESPARVVAVYTQPDRPAGRGRHVAPSAVKQTALAHGLPIHQPVSLKDTAAAADLAALGADLMIVVAYGLLLPTRILAAPRLGCINVHASLLPRWRGAAPIQRALLAGDRETGISIMAMEAGLDTGPVYLTRTTAIAPRETGGSLHDRLAQLGAEALMAALPDIIDGRRHPVPQDGSQATYASKLTKEEAKIDWQRPARAIERQILAFDPWPVAHTNLAGETLRIWDGEALDLATDAPAGAILAVAASGIDVATGDGILRVTRVQAPGRRPLPVSAFLNAGPLRGDRFG